MQTGELESLPDQHWLLPGVLQRGHVTLLYGPSTVGKSQVALCIAYAAAHGLTWGDDTFSPGLGSYIACEDIESIKVRARAWRILHNKLADPSIDNLTWFDGEAEPMFNLLDPVRMAALAKDLLVEQELKGQPLGVLVIDHRRKAMIPTRGRESVRGPYAAIHVMQGLRALSQRLDYAIILIAHTEKGGKHPAGPQEWVDNAQTVYRVSATNDRMLIENEKQRGGPLKHLQPILLCCRSLLAAKSPRSPARKCTIGSTQILLPARKSDAVHSSSRTRCGTQSCRCPGTSEWPRPAIWHRQYRVITPPPSSCSAPIL